MSSIIIFLYSKYVPQARLLLETIKKMDYIHTLCVDNELVRDIVNRSSLIKHKKAPCFIVIYPNKSVYQYIDDDVISFLNKLIEIENQKHQSVASSKSSISDILPEVSLEDNNNASSHIAQPTPVNLTSVKKEMAPNGRYSTKSVQFKKENIGDSFSHSEQDLVNYSLASQNNNIEQGKGHNGLSKSSLSNNSTSDNLSIIEDIEDNDNGLLINDSKPTENPNVSKKTSMKDIMNDMISERENLDTVNKKQIPR